VLQAIANNVAEMFAVVQPMRRRAHTAGGFGKVKSGCLLYYAVCAYGVLCLPLRLLYFIRVRKSTFRFESNGTQGGIIHEWESVTGK
jgi:hypothetical protein